MDFMKNKQIIVQIISLSASSTKISHKEKKIVVVVVEQRIFIHFSNVFHSLQQKTVCYSF